jgi:general secretion pathway protein J
VSRSRIEGFSLIEAVAAVALTSTIVLALGSITGLWLPNWRRGFEGLQRSDLVELGLERIAEDLSVAEYVTPWADAPGPLFEGDPASVTFVRSAIGPNARPELEVVRIAEASDSRGPALVRTRSRFTPVEHGRPAEPSGFNDPVALIRAPLQVSFAYAGPEHVWAQRWKNEERLPEAIRVTVVDASSRMRAASTVVRLKITAPGAAKPNSEANATDATPPPTRQAPVSTTPGQQ